MAPFFAALVKQNVLRPTVFSRPPAPGDSPAPPCHAQSRGQAARRRGSDRVRGRSRRIRRSFPADECGHPSRRAGPCCRPKAPRAGATPAARARGAGQRWDGARPSIHAPLRRAIPRARPCPWPKPARSVPRQFGERSSLPASPGRAAKASSMPIGHVWFRFRHAEPLAKPFRRSGASAERRTLWPKIRRTRRSTETPLRSFARPSELAPFRPHSFLFHSISTTCQKLIR